jgi:hypothetical protein
VRALHGTPRSATGPDNGEVGAGGRGLHLSLALQAGLAGQPQG